MATDHKTRIRALDPRRSFIVQAPAGSGKTEVLTQRFLRLLATVERPESVLAITFTRKATQEMRSRISKRLAEAAAGVVPDKDHERRAVELASEVLRRDHKLGWNLEENPGRLRITTIDGLCVQLLARDPVHGPHWTGVKVLEDAKPLYRDAIRRLFRDIDAIADSQGGEAENARFAQQALVQLLVHFGGDSTRLEILLMEMLDKRSLWKRHLDARHEDLQELLRQRQQRAVDQFRQALGPVTLQEATRLVNRLGFESGAEGDSVQDELLASFRLARLLCTGSLKPRSPRSVSRGLFPDMDESQAPALEALREIYCQWHNESLALEALERMAAWPPLDVALEGESFSDSLLDDARSVLWLALYELDAVIGESGQADFTAVSDAAVESLGSEALPSDVMLAEDRRIDHILMDEFQDTSFSQFRLLTGLISGWQAGDGRTLFLVGDPMQSIYRFREANVGFFNEVVTSGRVGPIDVESLSLSSNFRSRDELISWFNATFPRIFPSHDKTDSGAVTYTAVDAEVGPGGKVEFHPFAAGEGGESQPRRISRLVQDALASPGELSIAILVRSRKQVPEITAELARNDIDFEDIKMHFLKDRAVIRDLLILTRVLLHPLDRIAWIALLRAPWCGLRIGEIHAVIGDDPEQEILASIDAAIRDRLLEGGSFGRLKQISAVMGRARSLAPSQPLWRRVEMCWIQLGGPWCCTDDTGITDAEVFLDLLQEVEQSGTGDVAERLDEALEKRYAASQPARVQIMTIHNAKGLQFDVVIVPDLARGTGNNAQSLVAVQEFSNAQGGAGVLMAPLTPAYVGETSLFRYINKVDGERAQYEDMRLLYVACTRARKELHLLASIRTKKDGTPSIPRNAFLRYLGNTFNPSIEAMLEDQAETPGPEQDSHQPPAYPLRRLKRALPDLSIADDDATFDLELKALPDREASALGTVLHQWLELIHDCPEAGWDRNRIVNSADSIRSCLRRAGAPGTSLDSLQRRCQRILESLLFDRGWLQQLLSESKAGSWAEIPFYQREGNQLRRHVIDLLVRDPEGTFRIIDYKTRKSSGSESGQWQDQLERYRQLIEKLADAPVSSSEIKILESEK